MLVPIWDHTVIPLWVSHSPLLWSDSSVFASVSGDCVKLSFPEVKAETEMETQGDLWEAVLSRMIRRWGRGTRKGRKPIWVCYQARKPCGQLRLPFQYGALGDRVERCPRVILFRTYESGNSSRNPYPLLASGHSRGDSFSSTSSMLPGEFQMQALEAWVPRACCRGSGLDSICCNYTDSFEEDGPVS